VNPRWGWCALVLTVACGHAPPPPSAGAVSDDPDLQAEAEPLAASIAELHGAPWKAPVRIRVVEDAAWWTVEPDEEIGEARELKAWLLAFGLRDPTKDLESSARSLEGSETLIAGMYLRDRREILLRRRALRPPFRRVMLSHELAHAYLDQQVGLRTLRRSPTLDGWLAWRATTEGHAELVSELIEIRKAGLSLERAIAGLRSMLPPAGFSGFRALVQGGGAPWAAPLARDVGTTSASLSAFPYLAGFRFMLEMHAAGGMRLVLSAVNRPPTSSSDILHARRYLAGEHPWLPIPATERAAPLGEAALLLLLERCTDPTTARRLAAHYESDRAALRKNPADGSLRLEWQTRWDDVQAAELAERTFVQLDRCPAVQDTDPEVPLGKEIHVRRERRHVVLVRGVSAAEAEPILLELLMQAPSKSLTIGPVPGKIPGVQTVVPGIPLAPVVDRKNREVRSDEVGLKVTLPEGVDLYAPSPSGLLSFFQDAPPIYASLSYFRNARGADFLPALEDVALSTAEDGYRLSQVFQRVETRDGEFAGKPCRESRWRRPNRDDFLRVRMVPLCEGNTVLVVVERWWDPSGQQLLDSVARSVTWSAPTLCSVP
jgi:hypothetical protein